MAGDELDDLYAVKPEEFTALRTKLATAAKKRGDTDAAKRISAARRPTTAAWVVNRLVAGNHDVTHSLTGLGERLRAAHAAMDGAAIRELSTEQRSLVDELVRAAFEGAEVTNPSATLREDVTSTLQAAVADPDVAQRLGHLAKAEQWSGFGDFVATTAVSTSVRSVKNTSKPTQPSRRPVREQQRDAAARESAAELEQAKAVLAAAESAKDDADSAVSDRQTDLAVARLRRDEMRQRLSEAERALGAAEAAYGEAKQASRESAAAVREAKARLTRSKRTR